MKIKKILALVLTMLMLVSSMAVATLPVLAEGDTVPTMKLRGWGVEGGQTYNVKVSGLTVGEPYQMKILYKAHEGKAQFLYNDTVLMLGSEVQNGASYDAATSTLTYFFAAAADTAKFTLKLTDHGAWNSAFISSLLVEDKTGKNVYEVTPVYTDGVLTSFEGWSNGGWWGGITFEEKAIADFGADMSTWDTAEGEVVACAHEYDDEFDANCNKCGEVRLVRVLGKAYGVTGKGWKNEDTQTIGVTTDALTEGATYTVSFLYKVIKGVPYVTISGLGDAIKLVEDGEAVNGATFDKATGAYSYTFTAPAGKVGVRTAFNTAESGYSEFYMADVKFTDAEGNVVDEGGFVQFDGWSDGWGGNFNGCTWTEFDNSVFACAHEYDSTRDADCNLCGTVREVANDLGTNRIELTWKGNGDDMGTYYYVDLPTEIGKEYTFAAEWQYLSGNVELKVDGNIVMENNKAAEGVIYADKVVAYTFTATKETTRIGLKPTAKGNNYVVEMGEPMLYVGEELAVRSEPGTTWTLGNSWNAWPNKVTPIDALSESVGINEIQLTWKSNGDDTGTLYELGLAATAGKTYTLKFKYLYMAGNFEIRLANASERITLMTGTTPVEGVTFEDDYLTYTFTANGPISLQLKAADKGVSNKAQIGEITLTDDAGTVTDPTFGSAWTAYFTWNAWPMSVTPVEEFATALGNTELQLCWKTNGDDMGTFYYIDLPTVTGKTYNFSAKYIQLDGAGFELKLGGVVLMKGTDVVAEGVTYEDGIVSYTFTATGASTRLALNCAAKGDKTTAQIGEISAIETESGVAATTLGLKWALGNSWNAWPSYQKDIEEIGKRVGNVQINLCFKNDGTDGTGTSYGLTLQAVVGTEYTLKLKYLPISGPGFQMRLGSTVLMNGATPEAGVTYDPETYELTYTFTADNVAPVLYLKSVNFGDNNTARIGEIRLVDGNGNELLPVPGSNWTLYTSYNAWPFSVTEVESIACPHAYDNDCDADCNVCGATREAAHTYENACDADCDICGELREVGDHVYDDDQDTDCNECGEIREIEETHTPGDVNGDGAVNNRDVMFLTRYLNEWEVVVVEAALDINGDGSLNNRDVMFLTRYLNEWDVQIF